MKTYIYLILSLALCCGNAMAQYQGKVYDYNDSAKVFVNSMQQSMPFCGGMNNPHICMADLNHDGTNDLVLYERYSRAVKTFINIGTPGSPKFIYAPKYQANFPFIYEYLKLQDYNADGIPDLFKKAFSGVSVYKGYYNANNELAFTYYKDLFYDNDLAAVPPTAVNVNNVDIPGIEDIDGDGDLDFVSFQGLGADMYYCRNHQVEESLPSDTIKVKLWDKCWGKVQQTLSRRYTMPFSCENDNSYIVHKGTLHGNNSVCLFDADGDGDYDVLNGNASFSDLQFLRNNKIQAGNGLDSMTFQDTNWQVGGKKLYLPQYPAAYWIDIDQDGAKDILVSPHAEGSSENFKCVWFYKNTGSNASPTFTFKSDSMLVDQMIDAGTGSHPCLYDYDKDGKPDLIVGSDGFFQASGILKSRLLYYKNTSTPGHISFEQQSTNFNDIFALSPGLQGAAPTIGDLDNDGKDDLILGKSDGTIAFYPNTASSAGAQPMWPYTASVQLKLKDINGAVIDAGDNASPFIYDLNKDGKPDLIIGNLLGNLVYYENVSTTPAQVKLQHKTGTLGSIKVDPSFPANAAPFIGKIDNTGIDYLLVGSNSGRMYRYDGFQGGNTTGIYPRIDSAYAYLDTSYAVMYNPPAGDFGGYLGDNQRSTPAVADIDGDGKYDMIVGNLLGGLKIFKQVLNVPVNSAPVLNSSTDLRIYPNPANDMLYFSWTNNFASGKVYISLYSTAGQTLLRTTADATDNSARLSTRDIAPGIYFCEIRSANGSTTTPVNILR